MPSFEDTSIPLLRTGSQIPFIDLQEVRPFDGTATAERSTVEHLGHRICGQCFLHVCFCFFFLIPFLPGSPFRVFNPPGNKFFKCPCFLPELPLKVANPSGCSFLPRPPFRVFSLASLFIFPCFSFCFFILAIDHRSYWGESPLVTCIEMDTNTLLFMHVSSECT